MRALLCSILFSAVAFADATPPERAKKKSCLDETALWREDEQLAAEKKGALEAKLHELGYELVTLTPDYFEEAETNGDLTKPHLLPPWKLAADEKFRKVVSEPPYSDYCGANPDAPAPQFVRASDGSIRRLIVQWHVTKQRALLSCGCPPQAIGRCGAPLLRTVQRRWILPGGARYQGDLSIALDTAALVKSYKKTTMQECPPLPQPPAAR